jgi:hypothetical protein
MRHALPITQADRARIGPLIKSWQCTSDNFPKMEETDLIKAAIMEGQRKSPRQIIVHRCITRFRTLRTEREAAAFEAYIKASKETSP